MAEGEGFEPPVPFHGTLGPRPGFEEVADILGNSPEVVRKHYAKWSRARQGRIDELMNQAYFGMDETTTKGSHWTN